MPRKRFIDKDRPSSRALDLGPSVWPLELQGIAAPKPTATDRLLRGTNPISGVCEPIMRDDTDNVANPLHVRNKT